MSLLIGFGGYTGRRYIDWCCQFFELVPGYGRSKIRSCGSACSQWRRFWRFGTHVEARAGSVSVPKNGVFLIFGFSTNLCDQFWENMRSVMRSLWMRFFFFFFFDELWKKKKGYILGRRKRKDWDWFMRALGLWYHVKIHNLNNLK